MEATRLIDLKANGNAGGDFFTSLDSIETSAHFSQFPLDHRSLVRNEDSAEWEATDNTLHDLFWSSSPRRVQRFRDCGGFAYFAREKTTGEVKVISSRCHNRWCPLCARAKAALVTDRVREWLEHKKEPKMLTLTLASHSDPLNEQIARLYASFRELRRRKVWKERVRGGVWFFQVTYNHLRKQWHPHLHCLLDGSYIPQELISEYWHQCTGDSYVIHIRSVDKPDKDSAYVARYVARPGQLAQLDDVRRRDIVAGLSGVRLHGAFGTGRQVKLAAVAPEVKGDFYSIGSWRDVLLLANTSPQAWAIFHSWNTGTPLPAGIDIFSAKNADEVFHYDFPPPPS